jgi:hypothetical protein
MKPIYCFLLILVPSFAFCQSDSTHTNTTKSKKEKKQEHSLGLGIKAGLNFTNVTGSNSISNSSETGYQIGLFLDPKSNSMLGSRTELVYSRQGYNYATGLTTGSVFLDYITLAQLMAINITHFVQIQFGAQMSYLMNAKADSTKSSTGNASIDGALSYFNKIDAGFGLGLEVRPFKGILLGARYNISLTKLYNIPTTSNTEDNPSYIPSESGLNFKNNLVQIYLGYRF